jgi:spore coat protein CotH
VTGRTWAAVLLALAWGCGDKGAGNEGTGLFPANYNSSLDPFDEKILASYRLQMDPADWDAIVADPWNRTWRRATLDWQGEIWTDVAVRAAGQRSRIPGNPKPSLRIKFNYFIPHRKFHSRFLTGVRLTSDTNDPSMMRRRLEDGVYRASGLPMPRCVHARLYVNDAYKGLFQVEERLNRGFVEQHFGDPIKQMYDFSPDAEAFAGHNDDVTWAGPDSSLYVPHLFAPQLRELDPNNPDLKVAYPDEVRDFIQTVNTQPWSTIAKSVDVDHFCRFMAAEVMTGEADAYVAFRVGGSPAFRSANFRIYPNPHSGKWIVLAWDREEGYWDTRESIVTGFDQRILTRNLILADPATLASFKQILGQLASGPASTASMNDRIDQIVNQVQAAADEDPFKTAGSAEGWAAHVQTLRDGVARQNAMVQSQLER